MIESNKVEILSFRPLDEPFKNLASVFIPMLYSDTLEQLRKEKELASDLVQNSITLVQLVEMLLEKREKSHLYLIVDQFEELFTLTKDPGQQNAFLDQLLLLINSDLKVSLLLSIRADFLSHISYYEPFNKAYNDYPNQMLSLLSHENLKRIIEEPAEKQGVIFQEGLVERIIEEIENEAGQLPLLEFALEQFWANKKGRVISHAVLDEMQSISHSISHYADKIYKDNPKYHASIKKVLIKLVNVGSGTEDTRRIAFFDEFDKEARETITLLANKRLIVTEDENIDIVHEALIREWKRLQKWINEYRDFLEWEKHLRDDRKFYVQNGEKKEDLLVESKLLRAKEFLASHEGYITPLDRGFLEESIKRKNRVVLFQRLGVFGLISLVVFTGYSTYYMSVITQDLSSMVKIFFKNEVRICGRKNIETYQFMIDRILHSSNDALFSSIGYIYSEMGDALMYKFGTEQSEARKVYFKALNSYTNILKDDPNNSTMYNNIFELELILNKKFDQNLENSFSENFGNDSKSMMIYEMLEILKNIVENKESNIKYWKIKYRHTYIFWNFTTLEVWVKVMPDSKIKSKLEESIKIFKNYRKNKPSLRDASYDSNMNMLIHFDCNGFVDAHNMVRLSMKKY